MADYVWTNRRRRRGRHLNWHSKDGPRCFQPRIVCSNTQQMPIGILIVFQGGNCATLTRCLSAHFPPETVRFKELLPIQNKRIPLLCMHNS